MKLEDELKQYFPNAKEIHVYPSDQYFIENEDGEVIGVLEDDDTYYQLRIDGNFVDTIAKEPRQGGGL